MASSDLLKAQRYKDAAEVAAAQAKVYANDSANNYNELQGYVDESYSYLEQALAAEESAANSALTAAEAAAVVSTDPTYKTLTVTGDIEFETPLNLSSGGTGATSSSDARNNLGAAASGGNDDITSMASLGEISSDVTHSGDNTFSGSNSFASGATFGSTVTGTDIVLSGGATIVGTSTLTKAKIGSGSVDSAPIGATTPSTGAFTTLKASGATTLSGSLAVSGVATSAGVTDASNASTGVVGEVMSATGSSVSLATGTVTNLTSLALTAGDWEVESYFSVVNSAALSYITCGNNSATSAIDASPYRYQIISALNAGGQSLVCPRRRYSISSGQTVYLNIAVSFSSGSCTATGYMYARRIR